MSTTSTNYSFGGVATTATTLGMSGLLLLGGAAAGAPAKAAESAPAGEVSAAVAGSHHSKAHVVLHAPSAATKGDSITLKGKVKKNHHHKTRVVIQKKHHKKWQKVDATKTNKKGKFHTDDAFGKKHKVKLRAKAKGHGVSATQLVTFTKAGNGGGTGDGGGDVQPAQPQAQSITWDTNLGSDHLVGDSMTLQAHADSGETVTYTSSNTKVANISGTTVAFTGPGDATITATVPGDAHWKPASTSQTLTVTPPDDPMQVFVPEGDTQALLNDIDQAPNGATLHLSGTYNVSNTGHETIDGDDWYSGIVVNKALTLDGGKLKSDGSSNVVDVGPQGDLTLEGGINIQDGKASKGAGIYDAGNVTLNDGYIWGNVASGDGPTEGGGVYITSTGSMTMNGGRIDKNTAENGSGVLLQVGASLYLYGNAEIENNYGHGGAVQSPYDPWHKIRSAAVSDENGWVLNPDSGYTTASWHVHDNSPWNIAGRDTV